MDSEKLIELVRENPALYDMNHKNYSNTVLKNKMWNDIGTKLNMRGTECKKTWVGLRDTYRRVVKKRRETRSGQPAVRYKIWKYEEQLSFLEPHMHERDTKNSLDPAPDNAAEMEESLLTPDAAQADTLEALPYFSKKTKTPETASGALMKYLLNEQQQTKKVSSMRSFLMSMADTAEKFSELNQHKAKSKIFSIISEIEFEEMTNRSNNARSRNVATYENSPSNSTQTSQDVFMDSAPIYVQQYSDENEEDFTEDYKPPIDSITIDVKQEATSESFN